MRRVALPQTGREVAAVGFGGSALSGSYGPVDLDQARALLLHAMDLGVDFFDTADVYGNGLSETVIGRAAAGRASVAIGTKVGMVRSLDRSTTRINCSPRHIRDSCDGSLARLGRERIDIYYLHRVDPQVPIEDSIGAMADLIAAGKVGGIGICEAAPQTLRRAHRVHPLSVCQMEYSLWCREAEDRVLPLCRQLGIAFAAYCPLGRGFLTGTVAGAPSGSDIRARDPRFDAANMASNRQLLAPVQQIARHNGCTPGQVALAWLLGRGPDIVPIPGTRSPQHLAENVGAADLSLSDDDRARLDRAFPPGVAQGARGTPEAMARLGH